MKAPLLRILLRGPSAELERTLDWCFWNFDVLGVAERDGEIEIALADDAAWPDLAAHCGSRLGIERLALPQRDATGLEHDVPVFVSQRLVVRPPWVDAPADFDGVTLIVPRGGAFGSGEHGSTRAALLALEAIWPAGPVTGFADVGTGSGILALYAAARGAAHVIGCDIDAASVRAARELVPAGEFSIGGPELWPSRSVPFVVANLTAAEQRAVHGEILRIWDRRGPLVLSGARPHEVDSLLALTPEYAHPVHARECDGFVALSYAGSVALAGADAPGIA